MVTHSHIVLKRIEALIHRIVTTKFPAYFASCDGFAVEVGHLRRSFQQSRHSFAPLTRGVNSFLQRSQWGRADDVSAFAVADPPRSCAAPASIRSLPKGDGPEGRGPFALSSR